LADEDRLSSSLQESLLTALCFNDEEIRTILPIITSDLFEGVYHDISRRVLDYRSRFGGPPGKGHIDDLFDDILSDTQHKHYTVYNRLIVGMLEQYSNGFNITYVVSRASDFVRRQQLKQGVLQAAERYQQGGETISEDVERILLDAVNKHVKSLDLGTFLGDTKRALRFLEKDESEYCRLGIGPLDRNGIYPAKKQLFMYIAPTKTGKSWWATYVAKMALLQGWKVAEITLEMSEELKLERYMQAFYSISRRPDSILRASFKTDELGRLVDLDVRNHVAKMNFADPQIEAKLKFKLANKQWQNKFNNLVVKEYPTGSITMKDVEFWLDSLEYQHNFVPDLLIIDSPYLMSLGDPKHHRQSLGKAIIDFRGMCVKRHMAGLGLHQVNREGMKARRVRHTHLAEDISIAFTCDNMLTYTQTEAEARLGLARLYADLMRNERSGLTVLISQSYNSGQFVLESVLMNDKYDDILKANASSVNDDDVVGNEDDD